MRSKHFLASFPLVVAAAPVFAHPGHGMPGWLHHGELLGLAAGLVGAVAFLWAARRFARRGRPS